MEDFVDIIGYKDLYKINRLGHIWSCNRNLLKTPLKKKEGYLQIHLYKDGKCKSFYLHRLIAIHFIDNPNDYTDIDHINGIKDDNTISNLRWITKRGNNTNRLTLKPKSKHNYIHISCVGNYRVCIRPHYDKTFTKLEDAILARDNILVSTGIKTF